MARGRAVRPCRDRSRGVETSVDRSVQYSTVSVVPPERPVERRQPDRIEAPRQVRRDDAHDREGVPERVQPHLVAIRRPRQPDEAADHVDRVLGEEDSCMIPHEVGVRRVLVAAAVHPPVLAAPVITVPSAIPNAAAVRRRLPDRRQC